MSAVVFDLDGVLVESEPYWQRAFAETANAWLDAAGSTRPRFDDADMTRFEGGRVNETLGEILAEVRADIDDPDVGSDGFLDQATSVVVERVAAGFAAAPQTIAASVCPTTVNRPPQKTPKVSPLAKAMKMAGTGAATACKIIRKIEARAVQVSVPK